MLVVMHPVLQLFVFWASAFATLCISVVLLKIYSDFIDSDMTLNGMRAELVTAGAASLVEAGSVWTVLAFIPSAVRALILPVLIVGLIYKLTHVETWSRYDVLLLLGFQAVIAGSAAALVLGHFLTAFALVGGLAVCLVIMAAVVRSL
jgi:hypothetical protein